MTKSIFATFIVASSFFLFSFSTPDIFQSEKDGLRNVQSLPSTCPEDVTVSNFVVASNVTLVASRNIISSQTILEGSNVIYRSGSGTTLAHNNMTGPSPAFQIFHGSTLTIEIDDCNTVF